MYSNKVSPIYSLNFSNHCLRPRVKFLFCFCTSSQLIHCIEDWIKDKRQVVIEDCYSNFFRNICNNGLLEVSISEIFAKVWDNSEELLQFILCVPSLRFFLRGLYNSYFLYQSKLYRFQLKLKD